MLFFAKITTDRRGTQIPCLSNSGYDLKKTKKQKTSSFANVVSSSATSYPPKMTLDMRPTFTRHEIKEDKRNSCKTSNYLLFL